MPVSDDITSASRARRRWWEARKRLASEAAKPVSDVEVGDVDVGDVEVGDVEVDGNGKGETWARRRWWQAKRLASEAARVAHLHAVEAKDDLRHELMEANDQLARRIAAAPSLYIDSDSEAPSIPAVVKRKKKSVGLRLGARAPLTSPSAARAVTALIQKPAIRHPFPPSSPPGTLAARCDACVEGSKILRGAQAARVKECAALQWELLAQTRRNNEFECRVRVAEHAREVDADELERAKKALFAANAAAKQVEARLNAQESRHRAEMQVRAEAVDAAEGRAAAAEVERDDADTALQHAMQRVDAVEQRADANFASAREVEENVWRMEDEHAAAMEHAALYRTRCEDLAAEKEHAQCQWSTDVLTRMSEIQIDKYREKRHILRAAMGEGGRGLHEAMHEAMHGAMHGTMHNPGRGVGGTQR